MADSAAGTGNKNACVFQFHNLVVEKLFEFFVEPVPCKKLLFKLMIERHRRFKRTDPHHGSIEKTEALFLNRCRYFSTTSADKSCLVEHKTLSGLFHRPGDSFFIPRKKSSKVNDFEGNTGDRGCVLFRPVDAHSVRNDGCVISFLDNRSFPEGNSVVVFGYGPLDTAVEELVLKEENRVGLNERCRQQPFCIKW